MILFNLQYITNAEGLQSSVVIPINEWQQLNAEYENLKKELSYYQLLINELGIISKTELIDRAMLSENQISAKQYLTLAELETETSNW